MSIAEIIQEVRALPLQERKELIKQLIDTLDETPQRNILEFEGVGAEMWHGVDAQEYVNQLRDEWQL
jgi:hypothetical protein